MAAARFSGKDPTKVDRSAAYAARYLAKNVVAAGLADWVHHPAVLCHRRRRAAVDLCRHPRHGQVDEAKLETALREVMDLSPRGIRAHLGLNKPIYARTAAYGHFGR
jgi:S-adenosylmethionine synthetase